MYQLSHLLSEQRSLLNSLASTSILGDETSIVLEVESGKENSAEQEEEERRHKLGAILEKVEGCGVSHLSLFPAINKRAFYIKQNVLDVPGRSVLHEGDLLELDPTESNALKRVHGYLFTDGLMLAEWNPNR